MSSGYTKLANTLVTSTIWRESSDVRVVWITMLALMNQHGEVHGSIPGLAHVAGVSIASCEEALTKFKSPDPYSRTQDEEGRRIRDIDGGWFIINGKKHRDLLSIDHRRELSRERMRRMRSKASERDASDDLLRSGDAPVRKSDDKQKKYAEAETKTDTSYTGISHEIPEAGERGLHTRLTEDGRTLVRNPNGIGWMPMEEQ